MEIKRELNNEHYSHQEGREHFLKNRLLEACFYYPDEIAEKISIKLNNKYEDSIPLFMGNTAEELKDIYENGEFFEKTNHYKKMRTSQCHNNSAELYYSNKDKYKIVTGYALSEDALWRSHSWLINENNETIETTEGRVCYYGKILIDEKEIQQFLEDTIL